MEIFQMEKQTICQIFKKIFERNNKMVGYKGIYAKKMGEISKKTPYLEG